MILGTISAVDNDNGLQLIIDGEETATTKKYTYMASYVPAANDRVLIEEISGSYVIMGKVISDYDLSGVERQADNATTSASCTGNAATATKADSLNSNNYREVSGFIVKNFHQNYNAQIGYYIDSITGAAATIICKQ